MIESQKLSVLLRLLKLKLARLRREQSSASRRNTLKAVSAVLRRLQARALEEYPSPPRKIRKTRHKKKMMNEWSQRKPVNSTQAAKLQKAKVPIIIQPSGGAYAPAWAAALAIGMFPVTKIRAANRSIATRRALLAELSLRADALANGER